jgi:hypothetical protein
MGELLAMILLFVYPVLELRRDPPAVVAPPGTRRSTSTPGCTRSGCGRRPTRRGTTIERGLLADFPSRLAHYSPWVTLLQEASTLGDLCPRVRRA